jgi:hypothetical protein
MAPSTFPLLRPAAVLPVAGPTLAFAPSPSFPTASTVTGLTSSDVRLVPGVSVLLQVAGPVEFPAMPPVPVPLMRLIVELLGAVVVVRSMLVELALPEGDTTTVASTVTGPSEVAPDPDPDEAVSAES